VERETANMAEQAVLQAVGLSKSYGPTRALQRFTYDFMAGRLYVLVGENGSGKSTLVKLLGGVFPPDSGHMVIRGQKVNFNSPADAMRSGIAVVHQEIFVEGNLSVLENVCLSNAGQRLASGGVVGERNHVESLLKDLFDKPPLLDEQVEDLGVAAKQKIAIARALAQPYISMFIFDEPTSVLDKQDSNRVLSIVKKLLEKSIAVIYITHRLDEIEAVSTMGYKIIVLRDGILAGEISFSDYTPSRLIALMSGKGEVSERLEAQANLAESNNMAGSYVSERNGTKLRRQTVMLLENFALDSNKAAITLSFQSAMITGVAGLEGHGQDALVMSLCGLYKPYSGRAFVIDNSARVPISNYKQAVSHGVIYVPRERKLEGILPTMSILDNFAMPSYGEFSVAGIIKFRKVRQIFDEFIKRLSIKVGSTRQRITSLSGGTQQKVLLARWLARNPKVMVLNDPTRGIDIATKEELYGLLRSLTEAGMAIVMVSTDLDEICRICDRVLVLRNGEVSAEFWYPNISEDNILAAMFGQTGVSKGPELNVAR
jgi:ABC-type sugar transport system ATPase subunit